ETNQSEEDLKDKRCDEAQNSKGLLMDNSMNNYIAILYELCKDPNMREAFSKFVDYFTYLVTKRKLKMLKSTSELESPSQTSEHRPTLSSILSGLQFSAKDYPKTYLDLFHETLRIFNVYEVSREMKLLSFLLWDRYKQDFEEIRLIASGGFGKVYRVRHKLDCQEYAVKKIYMG
ncbi:Interferon-induced, double-stranded RNA-activated protein kinase, partial [Armadillidium nasatum]